jgi:hypothetical protein
MAKAEKRDKMEKREVNCISRCFWQIPCSLSIYMGGGLQTLTHSKRHMRQIANRHNPSKCFDSQGLKCFDSQGLKCFDSQGFKGWGRPSRKRNRWWSPCFFGIAMGLVLWWPYLELILSGSWFEHIWYIHSASRSQPSWYIDVWTWTTMAKNLDEAIHFICTSTDKCSAADGARRS